MVVVELSAPWLHGCVTSCNNQREGVGVMGTPLIETGKAQLWEKRHSGNLFDSFKGIRRGNGAILSFCLAKSHETFVLSQETGIWEVSLHDSMGLPLLQESAYSAHQQWVGS